MFGEANAELEETGPFCRHLPAAARPSRHLSRSEEMGSIGSGPSGGLYPIDGTIQFNLACYEAQMGSLDRAKAHLKRATEIDAKLRLLALEDPDLEPLWAPLVE
jgi:hypothetical protein